MSAGRSFQRAYSAEHKAQRAQDLITAARTLAVREGVRAVTLTAIAQHAGVHVSAVRRYYASREEILLKLASEGYEDWAEALVTCFGEHEGLSATDVAHKLVASLGERPLLSDLFTHTTLSLEHEVSYECVRDFKRTAYRCVNVISGAIAAASVLDHAGAELLLTATVSLAATLWQAGNPAKNVVRLYQEEPNLAHIGIDFEATLTELLVILGKGLTEGQNVAEDAERTA